MSDEQDTKESYAMELLFRDHHAVLLVVCFVSLILGVPLAWNMLWHLQVRKNINQCVIAPKQFLQIATNAKGRGVLRLLLKQYQMNLLCVPGLLLQLFMTAFSSKSMPTLLCFFFEVLFFIVLNNRVVSDLSVALGRYVTKYVFRKQSH